jgi:hypothetical protein
LAFTSSLLAYWLLSRISRDKGVSTGTKGKEERPMAVQEKSIQYPAQVKTKWWYWPLLILGSVMVVGGIVWVVVL